MSFSEPALYAFISVGIVSLISLIGLFFVPDGFGRTRNMLLALVGLAVGALLGDAFIHLLPEAMEELGGGAIPWVLGGMALFFIFEKFLHWRHHHHVHDSVGDDCGNCEQHVAPFGTMVVTSDALHNMIDGVIIAAGFLVSTEVGIATTIAVVLHEIPQEIGDFGALLHAGFTRSKALMVNFVSALSAFVGAGLVFVIGISFEGLIPILSALAAGAFIYIAAVDLVPELHKAPRVRESLIQLIAIILGVAAMFALTMFEAEHEEPPVVQEETGQVSDPEQYVSVELGISFAIPPGYFVVERDLSTPQRRHHSIQIVEDTPFNRDLVAGKVLGTEGPTSITIDAYQNDLDKYSAESWVRGHSASNFKLSPDGGLAHTTLDDHPALKYRWSGLYEADNTVVATADYVFSFAVTYLSAEDPIRRDFESFLQTVDLR